MQHTQSLEQTLDSRNDMEDMLGLDFCNHDDAWLDYCSLGGHEHYALASPAQPGQRLAKAA